MLIDDMLFEQSWFADLPLRKRFLYIYLLTKCSKVGVFEVNLRRAAYDINDGAGVTRDDIFKSFGDRVKPLGESKGIFVDYISFNWVRGKPLDPNRNPLHKGLAQELARYGLDFAKVNALSTKKNLKWVDESGEVIDTIGELEDEYTSSEIQDGPRIAKEDSTPLIDIPAMFDKFWLSYPSSCPRKVDKKKCREKFANIIKKSKDPQTLFNKIIAGVGRWSCSDMWLKDNGQYIKAPLVWLNGSCWEDEPLKGVGNGNKGRTCTANANYKSDDVQNIF